VRDLMHERLLPRLGLPAFGNVLDCDDIILHAAVGRANAARCGAHPDEGAVFAAHALLERDRSHAPRAQYLHKRAFGFVVLRMYEVALELLLEFAGLVAQDASEAIVSADPCPAGVNSAMPTGALS